jgi:hypothetical protein
MTKTLIDAKGQPHEELTQEEVIASIYGTRCTVRAAIDGRLFDPKNRDHEGGLTKRDASRGRFVFDFRRCSQVCYNLYVSFLKTGNRAFLNRAQREFQNG